MYGAVLGGTLGVKQESQVPRETERVMRGTDFSYFQKKFEIAEFGSGVHTSSRCFAELWGWVGACQSPSEAASTGARRTVSWKASRRSPPPRSPVSEYLTVFVIFLGSLVSAPYLLTPNRDSRHCHTSSHERQRRRLPSFRGVHSTCDLSRHSSRCWRSPAAAPPSR